MIAGTMAWLLGIVVLQFQPVLPALHWIYLFPLVLWLAWRCQAAVVRLPALVIAGFLWALLCAHWVLNDALPPHLASTDVEVNGQVVGIPERDGDRLRFQFEVADLLHQGKSYPPPGRVRLSWYRDAPALGAGEWWRLNVRLKPPRGFSNPGSFDYEGWLYGQGIRATGYVRNDSLNRRLPTPRLDLFSFDRWRAAGVGKFEKYIDSAPLQGVLIALAFGHRPYIDEEQWRVLRHTGTSHLVAISGLHVGLVAGLVFAVVRLFWVWLPGAALYLAAPRAAACAATVGALAYAALAGFSIPTQRALIMVAVVMGGLVFARNLKSSRTFFVALALILAWDPRAVLSIGFWLSFAAVAAILWMVCGKRAARGLVTQWCRVQLAIFLGLFPLLAFSFGQVALIAPVANLIAIPWVGFVVVPLVLLSVTLLPISEMLASFFMQSAHTALAWVWWILERLSALPIALWEVAQPPLWSVVLGSVGVAVVLLPRGVPLRLLGALFTLPMLLNADASPTPENGFHLALLDVGQGLAVVVRTAHHTLLYDTGPRFGERFDAGAAVIVPYLRHLGIRQIDRLIISHGDSDHSGGADSVRQALRVVDLKRAPEPGETLRAIHCQAGQSWNWDGVIFNVLYPFNGFTDPARENDHSCVLSIHTGKHGVLLSGDIEQSAELHLLRTAGDSLAVDLVVVPHHGSSTSSSEAFIEAIRPRLAWVSAGQGNRWGFPRPEVVERYRAAGAEIWTTADSGALEVTVEPVRGLVNPRRWRAAYHRYWHTAFGGQDKSSTIAPLVSPR